MQRPWRCFVFELRDRIGDAAPSGRACIIAGRRELVGAVVTFGARPGAVSLEHQVRGTSDINLGYHLRSAR
jgi:hypothetical protein